MTSPEDLIPAEHVVPAPSDGWKAADLSDEERVDDEFIAANAARTYPPLLPADEKIFTAEAPRGS